MGVQTKGGDKTVCLDTADMLREYSLLYASPQMWNERILPGWYCLSEEKRLLTGAKLCDAGNIETSLDQCTDIADRLKPIRNAGAVPVIMGGDHSVTGRVVDSLRIPLQILHFDAHRDTGPYEGVLTRKNVISYLASLDHVRRILTVGIRGIIDLASEDDGSTDHEVISMHRIRNTDHRALNDSLDSLLPVYLSIDCDVLDPSVCPSVACPSVGGLTIEECVQLLKILLRSKTVIGVDFVEAHDDTDPYRRLVTGDTLFILCTKVLDIVWTH